MADQSFFDNSGPYSLQDLAAIGQADLQRAQNPKQQIEDVQSLDAALPGTLTFLSNPKYLGAFKKSKASACIVAERYVTDAPDGMALLVTTDPYKAYAKISQHFYPKVSGSGDIHESSIISPLARIGNNVSIGPGTVIEEGAVIGDGTVIGPLCFVGRNTKIGEACQLDSHATVRYCHMGDNVKIYSGARIGEDGFGFAPDPAGHIKIPQLGRVVIGSNVEIGANTTIDRGAGPDTIIGDNCWIDNLVQIAHNVRLGQGCIIAAQCGISGSTVLEDFVLLGGQVGLAGHITIGTGAQITAKSGVMSDIPAGKVYAGFPALPRKEFFRSIAVLRRFGKDKGSKA